MGVFDIPDNNPGYIDTTKQTSSHEVVLSGRNTEQTQEDYQKQFNELTKLKEEIQLEKAREFSDTEKKALAIIYKGLGGSNPDLKRAIENQSLNMIEIPHSEVILISTDGKTVNSIYNSNGEVNTEYSKVVSMDLQEAWGKLKDFYVFKEDALKNLKRIKGRNKFENISNVLVDKKFKALFKSDIEDNGGVLNDDNSISIGKMKYNLGDTEYKDIVEKAFKSNTETMIILTKLSIVQKKESLGL